MRWYAETGPRRTRQIVADLAMAAWVWAWWQVASAARELVTALGAPGRGLADTGGRLEGGFRDVGATLGDAPVVGPALGAPFRELADAADAIEGVGAAQAAAAADLGDWTAAVVLLLPVLVVGLVWAAVRLRGARATGAARALRDAGQHDLLALRALASRPLHELRTASSDPVADWRAGEVDALAALELRAQGLRP